MCHDVGGVTPNWHSSSTPQCNPLPSIDHVQWYPIKVYVVSGNPSWSEIRQFIQQPLELHVVGELALLQSEAGLEVGNKKGFLGSSKDFLVNSLLISDLVVRKSDLLGLHINISIWISNPSSSIHSFYDTYSLTLEEFLLGSLSILLKVGIVELINLSTTTNKSLNAKL